MQSEMNRVFSGFSPASRDFPPINIWLGDNSVVVTSELPGVTSSDVTLNLQDDVLTLGGARRPAEEQGVNLQRRERTYGTFSRAVQLPFRVAPDGVDITLERRVLTIRGTERRQRAWRLSAGLQRIRRRRLREILHALRQHRSGSHRGHAQKWGFAPRAPQGGDCESKKDRTQDRLTQSGRRGGGASAVST